MTIKPFLRKLIEIVSVTGHQHVPDILSRLRSEQPLTLPETTGRDSTRDITVTLPETADIPTFSAFEPVIANPVLRASGITDFGETEFVADPFFTIESDTIHLFFEVYNHSREPNSAIGHAVSRNFGRSWEYEGIVLETGVHISFPYVFRHQGRYYMLPEQTHPESHRVELFVASEFPTEWEHEKTLLTPEHRVQDHILFRHHDRWWLLMGAGHFDTTYAYYAETLRGPWTAHEMNPIITDRKRAAKPGGRPFVFEDRLIVLYQDCQAEYGHSVRVYEIDTLTPQRYTDHELSSSPIVHGTGGIGWNAGRMHHLDSLHVGENQWLLVADGDVGFPRQVAGLNRWSLGFYAVGF